MPAYTIQQDPPRMAPPDASLVSSAHNEDYTGAVLGTHAADVPSLSHKDSNHFSYHAHPKQQVVDRGPEARHSRLPLFKNVRNMLHSKPSQLTTPGNPKWDTYTGELSETGQPSHVKPSAYVSPWDGAFKANRKRSPERRSKLRKSVSPVSVLRDEEISPEQPVKGPFSEAPRIDPEERSPVSPISSVLPWQNDDQDEEHQVKPDVMREAVSPNVQRARAPPANQMPSSSKRISRKPVSRNFSSAENHPPVSPSQSPSQSGDVDGRMIDDKGENPQPNSHFSWSTYAASPTPGRQSSDAKAATRAKGTSKLASPDPQISSRFSWSTVNTNVTPKIGTENPSPALQEKHQGPHVQSILSRGRPTRPVDKDMWAPPPRKSSAVRSAAPSETTTPTSRPKPLPKTSGKALPPTPPSSNDLTHLETLLASERSTLLQRRNVEKAIQELEKIEHASPLDVPFATVRDAKKRLAGYRARLAEVTLEERDVGIAIARARRRDEKDHGGDGESLWVRRVTG